MAQLALIICYYHELLNALIKLSMDFDLMMKDIYLVALVIYICLITHAAKSETAITEKTTKSCYTR